MSTPAILTGHDREIGGKLWTVTLLPATRGLDVGRRLVRIIGPAIGQAIGAVGAGGIMEADASLLAGAAGSLAEHLGEPDAAALVKELVTANVQCDGVPVTAASFDVLFAGDYGTLIGVAVFVVEVNYKIPLLSWLAAANTRSAERAKSAQPKPPVVVP